MEEIIGQSPRLCHRRRLEANYARNKGDPMDITEVNDGWGNQDEYYDEWGIQWDNGGYDNIDEIGKGFTGKGFKGTGKGVNEGKGKGKSAGFEGQCYSCGEYGHSASSAPTAMESQRAKGKSIQSVTVSIPDTLQPIAPTDEERARQ